jgi:hypothetical protein
MFMDFHVELKYKWPTIVVKMAQPLGSLHCNFVSGIPFQTTNIVSMQQLPQASVRHVFRQQKIRVMGSVKPQQSK